jgi:singapore isolate B (sub-type 7) whole genome shotgun sequence assembly, scaffold_12
VETIDRKEGIVGFYGGLLPNLIRVIPSSSLTLMTYEFVNSWLRDHHILD